MSHLRQPIISQIEALIADVPGWSPIDQLYSLYLLATTVNAQGDILELGSWCGRSALVLGMAASALPAVKVHCIDIFPERNEWQENPDGSFSMVVDRPDLKISSYTDQTVWREPFMNAIVPIYEKYGGPMQAFQKFVQESGYGAQISMHRGTLNTFFATQFPPPKLRLAFIDGDHGYDALCKDIALIEPLLAPGAWLCFDDAHSTYEGVDRAIKDKVLDSEAYDFRQQLCRKFFVARRK